MTIFSTCNVTCSTDYPWHISLEKGVKKSFKKVQSFTALLPWFTCEMPSNQRAELWSRQEQENGDIYTVKQEGGGAQIGDFFYEREGREKEEGNEETSSRNKSEIDDGGAWGKKKKKMTRKCRHREREGGWEARQSKKKQTERRGARRNRDGRLLSL